jgi:hypothetical protein
MNQGGIVKSLNRSSQGNDLLLLFSPNRRMEEIVGCNGQCGAQALSTTAKQL